MGGTPHSFAYHPGTKSIVMEKAIRDGSRKVAMEIRISRWWRDHFKMLPIIHSFWQTIGMGGRAIQSCADPKHVRRWNGMCPDNGDALGQTTMRGSGDHVRAI